MMQIKLAFSFEIVGKKKEVIGMTSQRQEEESAEECSGQFEHSFRINYREGNS